MYYEQDEMEDQIKVWSAKAAHQETCFQLMTDFIIKRVH